jgi:vacuolar-type H+-ATPase subunit H
MADLRDFLSRFRPAGAPGAARAGVPADRSSELEAELGPVLALLAGTDAECGQLIDRARQEARQVTAKARAEAAVIAAAAGKRAETMREEAARQAMASAREEAATAVRDAERQAVRTRELARQRRPALVSRAVDTIRQLRPDDR